MQNKDFFNEYITVFLEKNSKLNLISKNDERFLWEKHIFDSINFDRFYEKYKCGKTLLDIGTGGGFPSIPIALTHTEINVFALDSIRKKINAVSEIKAELGISNLYPICDRAENLKQKFDIVTSRAVAPLKVIAGYALPLLNKGGYFIAYKSKKAEEEIQEALPTLKKFNAKLEEIIEYDLPLDENHTRNLIVIRK